MIEVVLVQDHRRASIVAHQVVEAQTDVGALVTQLQQKYPAPRYATVVAMAPSAEMLATVYPPYADAAEGADDTQEENDNGSDPAPDQAKAAVVHVPGGR